MQCTDPTFDWVKHNTTLIIDGHEYHFPGEANANDGRLNAEFSYDLEIDPEILALFCWIGYPSCAKHIGGAVDLFKPSAILGGFDYEREYKLKKPGIEHELVFTSSHRVTFSKEEGLVGAFVVKDFPAEQFVGQRWAIQDLVETLSPGKEGGSITSHIDLKWKGETETDILRVAVDSQYMFQHQENLPGVQYRHVSFRNEKGEGKYKQLERITVFSDWESLRSYGFGEPEEVVPADEIVRLRDRSDALMSESSKDTVWPRCQQRQVAA